MSNRGGINGGVLRKGGFPYEDNLKSALDAVGPLKRGECIPVKAAGSLRCKWILNTNSPGQSDPDGLKRCYRSVLDKMIELKLESVIFCCIGTGGKGFYPDAAAQIAIQEVGTFLKNHLDLKVPTIRRVGFCVFTPQDKRCYEQLLPLFCN